MRLFKFLLLYLFVTSGFAQQNLQNELTQSISLLEKHHLKGYRKIENPQSFFIQVIERLDPDYLLFRKSDLQYISGKYADVHLALTTQASSIQKDLLLVLNRNLPKYMKSMDQVYLMLLAKNKVSDFNSISIIPDSVMLADDSQLISKLFSLHAKLCIEKFRYTNNNEENLDSDIKEFLTKYVERLKIEVEKENQIFVQKQQAAIDMAIKKVFISFQDPHSSWLNTEEYSLLKTALSLEEETFGLTCKEDKNGKLIIDRINPASDAALLQHCKEGDEIISLHTTLSKKEAPDLNDWYDINLNEKISSVQITTSNQNGQTYTFTLKRERFENTENIVRGFILSGQESVGYVSIPSFFTEWDTDTNNKTLSNALAKEIIKLKQVGIKGLVLDFRDNSGGSLVEAIELISLFTDSGPMFQFQFKNKEGLLTNKVARDFVRGRLVDIPLVIMVNGASASASELFTASLQTQGQALVVGSTTYGKGTYQTLLPLYNTPGNHEFLTVTNGMIYTIDGKTYQVKGVVPDIELNEIDIMDYSRESDYANALQPTELKTIASKQQRISKEFIQSINANALNDKVEVINRNLNKGSQNNESDKSWLDEFEKEIENFFVANSICEMKVIPNFIDIEIMQSDPELKDSVNKQTTEIDKDPYIQQTYKIINQLIKVWK
jgi:carboxyl-terminal processing protease